MKDRAFSFEIKDLMIQFVAAFDNGGSGNAPARGVAAHLYLAVREGGARLPPFPSEVVL